MKNLQHLNKYFWKYRGRMVLGLLFITLANIFNVYAPVLVGEGIDFLVQAVSAKEKLMSSTSTLVSVPPSLREGASWLGHTFNSIELTGENFSSSVVKIALMLAVGYFVFHIFKGIFLFYQRQTIIVISRYIEYDLKNEIYDQYQKLDMAFYKRNRTGDLMNRISEDVSRVRMYIGPAVMYTLNLIVLVIMCVWIMLKIDVSLTLFALSPLPFMMVGIYYVSQIINRRTDKVQAQQSTLSTMVQETISGIRVLKAFAREPHYENEFSDQAEMYYQRQMKLVKAEALFMPVIALLVGLSTILTVYAGSLKVAEGSITTGVIVQFVFYVNQLTWPFALMGWVSSLVQKAEASQARINEFLRAVPDIQNPTEVDQQFIGELRFKNVNFNYPDSGIHAIKNISFSVPPGKTLAIIGKTGSGKSTLANLMLRMYDPDSGEITIDGKKLNTINLSALRSQTGYVPQDVFLFSDTIRNNISFGKEASEEAIIQAARDADIHDNIVAFPNGYDTLLGERGINVSGGQKQRISIARALLKNPAILLLDDCLSAVDTQTEENILRSLKRVMENRTSIIIAHRISSIKHADHIVVMDNGTIVEEGTHAALLSLNRLYASIYRKQLMEKKGL
ncbi:MAG: ABC transporter ATP-binding protein [Crocinitomicaceae bacterium]|nr:ABC transporter ATP-binding protein [Crocinitomicaceae bacterium]